MFNLRTAVLGLSAAAIAAIGVGVAGSQAATSIQPDTTCNSSSPCTSNTNNGSGSASANTSVGGTGSTSTTDFKSTSSSNFAAGIHGVDGSSTGKFDAGVQGTSPRGMGVSGKSTSGTGVNAVSTSGIAVNAVSTNGTAVVGLTHGTGPNAAAIIGSALTSTGIGVFGSSQNIGVLGQGAIGVLGTATTSSSTVFQANGSGGNLFASNTSGTPEFTVDGTGDVTANGIVRAAEVIASTVIAGESADLETSNVQALFARVTDPMSENGVIEAVGAGGPLFTAFGSGETEVAGLDNVGNLGITGLLFTSGFCSSGCIKHGPNQKRIVSYAPRESQPTMEDFGESQVVNGEAHVTLDPSFANVIERAANYLVFVTPEGDCNGLFIAAKSSTGFVVRELRGGNSSLEFEYRIVAKPFGDRSARLPEVVVHPDLTLNSRLHRAPTHA